jgi:TolB-like protein/tetratricopeptide (TPR) repeat protein
MLYRLNAAKAAGTSEARVAAVGEYERVRARLAEELGIGVDAAVERLVASIRSELPPIVSPLPAAPLTMPGTAQPAAPPHPAQTAADAPTRPAAGNAVRARARFAVPLAVLVAIVGAAAYGTRHSTADVRPILAVLPFENLGAPGDAYFADGLTDELRARLTGISGIRVIGGTSARQYKGATKSPRDIARELGATYLLTGSVRWERMPSGGRVRVSPELVRAADQANVWAEPVEGTLDDVFAMQARVAERVASALDVALRARERQSVTARPTSNLAAYDSYLRGMGSVSSATRFSAASRRATQAEFERAIALDPTFAVAYARLAESYIHDLSQAGDSATAAVARTKARDAVERAWALDSTLVETRLARVNYLYHTGGGAEADRLVRETARVAPDNVEVLSALADAEFNNGQFEDAIAAHRHATLLDPRAADAWGSMAGSLDRLRRYDEAIAAREREIALVPDAEAAYASQASSYLLWRADTAAARRTLERGSLTLPWVVRLPGGIAGNAVWAQVVPPSVLRSRDTLTLAGYLAGAGGIAPELYHLVKLRHHLERGRADRARAHADSLVALLEPVLQRSGDAHWFFGWFSRRSVLAEAYATLNRTGDAARQTDRYVAETREEERARGEIHPEQLCHALHNAAYVDAQIGRKDVAVARLTEALRLTCGVRVSQALLAMDPSWSSLRGYAPFEALLSVRQGTRSTP